MIYFRVKKLILKNTLLPLKMTMTTPTTTPMNMNFYVSKTGMIILTTDNKFDDEFGRSPSAQILTLYQRTNILSFKTLQLKKIKGAHWVDIVSPDILDKLNAASAAWMAAFLLLQREGEDSYRMESGPGSRYWEALNVVLYLDHYERIMIENLHYHDAAVMIQSVIRGKRGRYGVMEVFCRTRTWEVYNKEYLSISRIQAAWRRHIKRFHLGIMRMHRELIYTGRIAASLVIHEAWADYKLRQRLKFMVREQKRKQYSKLHGLDELFAKAIDMAIEIDPIVPAFFVSNYILMLANQEKLN